MKIIACMAVFGALSAAAFAQEGGVFRKEIHGLDMEFDLDSGALLSLSFDGMQFLKSEPGRASLLDAAWPGQAYDPLRLGARYSHGAKITPEGEALVIVWDALGASREGAHEGNFSATVRVAPAADGRSVSMTATLKNHSPHPVPQVLFPDLEGLLPFAGREQTELRTCGFASKPFVELDLPEDEGRWYASRRNWLQLKSGAYDKSMGARWLDLGSLQGGFSLFPKLWSWGPLTENGEAQSDSVLLHLSQVDKTLRLMAEHRANIPAGGQWTSPEYVLTPHPKGWARGIEPFRAWVAQNVQRPYPLPRRLGNSLGFRSVWMAQQYAATDPAPPTVVWRFNDLPALAEESLAHGLNEMVLWLWQPWEIPDQPSPALGTPEEFTAAIEQCRARGVNVSLFISVMTLLDPLPARYGWNDKAEYWGYHTDYVPMLRPWYGQASHGSFADQAHPQWQADITSSMIGLVDRGWPSITWDQARYAPTEPSISNIFETVRAAAKQRDPESTFAAECLNNLDLDSRWLDYTWNWALYDDALDWRALVNAYPAPRFNVNVGSSPRTVKRLFMDHLFLNVLPSKPEGINGSARIEEYPELSAALKTCTALHTQFRTYLEEGLPVGDCILARPCESGRISAYLLKDRMLALVLNAGEQPASLEFELDIASWLPPSRQYHVRVFDESGREISARTTSETTWKESTAAMKPNELVLYEIRLD